MRRAAMVATTAGLIGCLCVLFAFQDGVRGGRLLAVLLVSVACVATGILMITSGGDEPIFRTRPRYVVGLAVVIGGSIASVYILGPGSTSLGATITIWVLGQMAVVAVLVFSTSPKRGGGRLMRLAARQIGGHPLPLLRHGHQAVLLRLLRCALDARRCGPVEERQGSSVCLIR